MKKSRQSECNAVTAVVLDEWRTNGGQKNGRHLKIPPENEEILF